MGQEIFVSVLSLESVFELWTDANILLFYKSKDKL